MLVAMSRLIGVAALLCLCACYNPTFRDCALSCTSDCPGNLTCDPQLHMCRLPGKTGACTGGGVDAALDPSGDADGDGKLNGVDNCPLKANPVQEDEDMDMLGDVCDPCPISPDNTDSDGDGLGDVCDPNPMPVTGHTIIDTIVFFDGFTNGLGSEVTDGSGSIASGSGVVELDGSGGHFKMIAFPLAASGGGETVTTGFTYTAGPGPTSGGGPMMMIDGTNKGIACVLFAPGGTGAQGEVDIEETANSSYDGSAPVSDDPSSGVHTLRIRRIPNGGSNPTIQCADGMMSASATPLDMPQTKAGLFIQDATAEFYYVMAVASGT